MFSFGISLEAGWCWQMFYRIFDSFVGCLAVSSGHQQGREREPLRQVRHEKQPPAAWAESEVKSYGFLFLFVFLFACFGDVLYCFINIVSLYLFVLFIMCLLFLCVVFYVFCWCVFVA